MAADVDVQSDESLGAGNTSMSLDSTMPEVDEDLLPPFEQKVLDERVLTGVYNEVVEKVIGFGKESLAEAEYGIHFEHQMSRDGKSVLFVDKDTHDEFNTLLVGETWSTSSGTILCVKGNHYTESANVGKSLQRVRAFTDINFVT
jgi:hypothetical protein